MSMDPLPGDEIEIADLYQAYQEPLRHYATRLTQDPTRADDLVQETFIRALAHEELLGRLNPHQRRAWLYRVLRNRFLDEQRARQRRQALAEQLARKARVDSYPLPLALSPEWFDQVPERYQQVLYMRYFLGMNSREIGDELGIPAATVRSRLHLAIKWLRTHQKEMI